MALHDLRIAWTPAFPGTPIAADIRGAIEVLARELHRREQDEQPGERGGGIEQAGG